MDEGLGSFSNLSFLIRRRAQKALIRFSPLSRVCFLSRTLAGNRAKESICLVAYEIYKSQCHHLHAFWAGTGYSSSSSESAKISNIYNVKECKNMQTRGHCNNNKWLSFAFQFNCITARNKNEGTQSNYNWARSHRFTISTRNQSLGACTTRYFCHSVQYTE